MSGLAWTGGEPPVTLRHDLVVPEPKRGQSLVRVTHTTVNGHEFDLATSPLLRVASYVSGVRGPVRTGLEFAGIVERSGPRFGEGDRVMGYVNMVSGWRPHAEYVAIDDDHLGPVPASTTLAESSTIPMGGLTALDAVRKSTGERPDSEVLVLGATGGVGLMAIQIARLHGATPVAVAAIEHHERLRSLGAAAVVDRSVTPLEAWSRTFDAVLDFSSTKGLADVRHLLRDGGVFVPADPIGRIADVLRSRRTRAVLVSKGDTQGLRQLAAWVEGGQLQTVVDSEFPLADWRGAVERAQTRGRIGRTVLSFDGPDE
ncbi:MAG: NADP-dependent oxidoreductase [Actinomycetota bacterium]